MNWNQGKIQIKQDAYWIYAVLRRFAPGECPRFTREMLADYSHLPLDRAEMAIAWLVASGFVQYSKGHWRTSVGDEWYQETTDNPSLLSYASDQDFRNQVLTGMDIYGAQTLIENAALPGSEKYIREPDIDTTEWEQTIDLVRKLSVRFGKPEEKIAELLAEGRIRVCKGPGGLAADHPGIFHCNGNGRLRSVCADCERLRKGSRPRTRVPGKTKGKSEF